MKAIRLCMRNMKEFNHMEAIEQEKAKFLEMNKAICDEVGMSEMWNSTKEIVSTSFDKGVQVAEKIVRADERERCLNAICSTCQDIIFCVDRNCMYINNIRKAIEEGGNNGK